MRDESLTDVISRLEKEIVELSSIQPYVVDAMALNLTENTGWDIDDSLTTGTTYIYEVTFSYSNYYNSYAQLFVKLNDFTDWYIIITDLFYQSVSSTQRKWQVVFFSYSVLSTADLKAHFKVISAASGSLSVVQL